MNKPNEDKKPEANDLVFILTHFLECKITGDKIIT